MNYEPTEDEIQKAIEESKEEGRRWRERASPEQLAAMDRRRDEAMERLLIVYGHKCGKEHLKELARSWYVSDEMLARVQERMKTPPHEDMDLVSAISTLGGLWPSEEIAEFHGQLEALSSQWRGQLLKQAAIEGSGVRSALGAAIRKLSPKDSKP